MDMLWMLNLAKFHWKIKNDVVLVVARKKKRSVKFGNLNSICVVGRVLFSKSGIKAEVFKDLPCKNGSGLV